MEERIKDLCEIATMKYEAGENMLHSVAIVMGKALVEGIVKDEDFKIRGIIEK